MSRKLGRWSFVCTCGYTTKNRALASIHVTFTQKDGKAHRIPGI